MWVEPTRMRLLFSTTISANAMCLCADHFAKEHEAQFLALCPLCAAMYNEFVKHDEGTMEPLKNALMNSGKPEISLRLGELDISLRFAQKHFQDIRMIIEAQE